MIFALILILIAGSTSAEDLILKSKKEEQEKTNTTKLEKLGHGIKRKYGSIYPLSGISQTVKNINWNEIDEKHKYFEKVLNQDELEHLNEEKWIEICKSGVYSSINEQNIQNFILNMISTRFCCCNENIKTEKQMHEQLQLINNIKDLPKFIFIIDLKNVLDLEKIVYHYTAKKVLKLFIECPLNTDDTVYDSFMSKNKLNIVLPYCFIAKWLKLTGEKSSINIILNALFESDLSDIYITSSTPVLDDDIDFFLSQKWWKNIKALSLNDLQKTADALKNPQFDCLSSQRHLNVIYKSYCKLSEIDLCKFTKLKSLKISGKTIAYDKNNPIKIHNNLYSCCEILMFQDTDISSELIKFITMFKKLSLLKLMNCEIFIDFFQEIQKIQKEVEICFDDSCKLDGNIYYKNKLAFQDLNAICFLQIYIDANNLKGEELRAILELTNIIEKVQYLEIKGAYVFPDLLEKCLKLKNIKELYLQICDGNCASLTIPKVENTANTLKSLEI